MQPIAHEAIDIDRPIEEVFAFVSNMENFGRWFPGVLSIVSKDDAPHGAIGKVYLERVRLPFKGESLIPVEVVACEAGELFQTQGAFPPLMPQMTVRCSRTEGGGARVDWRMESRNDGLLFRMTLLPVIRGALRKRAAIGVRALKELLEQKGARDAA